MKTKTIHIELPPWVENYLADAGEIYPTREGRMALAVGLSRRNIEERTGGPFGAAVFDRAGGKLIAVGVNLVTTVGLSFAHAEMVAVMQAQAALGGFDLGGPGMPECELVSSTEPCAMCLGAVPWSGVRSLVCGAADGDARAAGFDEGSKRGDWARELEARGIAVALGVLREEAAAVLRDYAAGGGAVYNGRRGGAPQR